MLTILIASGVLACIVTAVCAWLVGAYNGLMRKRTAAANAWARVDAQLQRRYDLIPQFVDTIQGYVQHDNAALAAVTAARAAALAAATPHEHNAAEQRLICALQNLVAEAQNYPELQANARFCALREQLKVAGDRISDTRRRYDDAVLAYNAAASTLATALIAGATGTEQHTFFAASGMERGPVQLGF